MYSLESFASENAFEAMETSEMLESCCVADLPRNDTLQRCIKTMKSAFNNRIIALSFENKDEYCLLPEVFLKQCLPALLSEVDPFVQRNHALKYNIELHTFYTKSNMSYLERDQLKEKIFKTRMREIFDLDDFKNVFTILSNNVARAMERFQTKEGGWTLLKLVKVDFNLNKYQPVKGSNHITLPKNLKDRRACVNVVNNDEFCFKWAVIAAIANLPDRRERTHSYKVNIRSDVIPLNNYILNFESLCFPLRVEDVSVFEENNPNISIHVFGLDEENCRVAIPQLYRTKKRKNKHINILYIEGNIEGKFVGHYIWIRKFTRLLKGQLYVPEHKELCDTCFQQLDKVKLEEHMAGHYKKQKVVMENNVKTFEFENHFKTTDIPFVIYANSECLFENNETYNPMPYVFTYFIKCSYDDDLSAWRSFKGFNAPSVFAENLIQDVKNYYRQHSLKFISTVSFRIGKEEQYTCGICLRAIVEKKAYYYYLNDVNRGPAHHICITNYKTELRKFPVIFYNLSYIDSLLFIKVFKDVDDGAIEVHSHNDVNVSFEKSICYGKMKQLKLIFLSFSMFMPCTLDYLVQSMSIEDFKTLKLIYPDDENKFNLVIRKGVFPYNYLNSVEKLAETSLPTIDYFYNGLLDKECSSEDYDHAKNIWLAFECNTLEDYLLMCIKIDAVLLTDIFEKYRSLCKKFYNLEPCQYHSAADFSWDAMLKVTNIKMNCITNNSIINFIRKGMRGPISHCFHRHSVANNKYLCDYNDKLPSSYLMYFHVNDLYGRVLSEPLPDGNFEWEIDIENFSLDSISNDSKVGYILEVHLQYPNEMLDIHKIFPYCIDDIISKEVNEHIFVLHYRNLQQYLKHGFKLKKILRILKFTQSDWLNKYILLNRIYKTNAKTSFETNVFELINTALYEKVVERVGKKIKIIRRWENEYKCSGARSFILKPTFNSVRIYDENTVAVELNTNKCNMPFYLEFVVSELAKFKMYNFHCEYMLPKYRTNMQLNYIDTDSVIYYITTSDLYKDLTEEINLMISTIAHNAINNSRLPLKPLGIMKDATQGVLIKEFIGLRSKMFSLRTEAMRETNSVINLENNLYTSLSDYKHLLNNKNIYCDNIISFKLKLHHRYTQLLNNSYVNHLVDNNRIIRNEETHDDNVIVIE